MPASKKKSTKKKLTTQERLFVLEYLIDLKPHEAALRAQYAETTALTKAFTWVSDSKCPPHKRHVYEAIKKALSQREEKLEITGERILQELALIAYSKASDYMKIDDDGCVIMKTFEEMPEGAARTIKGIKDIRRIMRSGKGGDEEVILDARLEYTHHDKMKALELLGKNKALFTDKLQVEGGPFVIVKRDYGEVGE